MSNYGLRKNNSTCGSNQQYTPFMMGPSRGFGLENGVSRAPAAVSVNTMRNPTSYCPQPTRTNSLNAVSVRDCLYWPASLNGQGNASRNSQASTSYTRSPAPRDVSGDFQYCSAPPKAYITAPGSKNAAQAQKISCQVAPLGTDPMSLIQPLAPLTVRVQAPADLFTSNSSEPRTISINPAQLYGGR